MKKSDFLNIFADGITSHEGYYAPGENPNYPNGTLSFIQNNQGNIKYVGQDKATLGQEGLCIFPDKYIGRSALVKDLGFKLDRFLPNGTIIDIVTQYAPPSENDTESYIESIVDWFNAMGWPITRTTSLQGILDLDKPTALVCLNKIIEPKDWKVAMSGLGYLALQCRQIGFTTRYTNEDVQGKLVTFSSPAGDLAGVSEDETRSILSVLNEGQEINLFCYNDQGLVYQGELSGGNEYIGKAVSTVYPHTSLAAVNFNGNLTPDIFMRESLHELIHQLFTLSGAQDYLHQYMINNKGYRAQDLGDLKAVYDSAIGDYLSKKTEVIQLQKVEIGWLRQIINNLITWTNSKRSGTG